MAQYLPSTPHPNFLDMRGAYGTKISLGLCSFFLCEQSVAACSGDSYGSRIVKTHSSLLFFFGGAFGKCMGGSDTPAIWDRWWISRLEFQGLRGFFGSPHPLFLLLCCCYFFERLHLFGGCRTQCGPPVVPHPSPTTVSLFSTPRSFFRTLALFLAAKFLFLELHHTGRVSRFVHDHFFASRTRWRRPLELILHLESDNSANC